MTPKFKAFEQIVKSPTWDGNLIGKSLRDELVKDGYVARSKGWNFLTAKGVELAVDFKLLKS